MTPITRLAASALLALLPLTALLPSPARADLMIDITRPNVEKLPIAITRFYAASEEGQEMARRVAEVITANLERSGLFRPLGRDAFLQTEMDLVSRPRFADWRVIGAQALVTGEVEVQPNGQVNVRFRLWDVVSESELVGMGYRAEMGNWRRVAHVISDEIYERLTGEEGYFNTRIVYIAESGPATDRRKQLAIMDQDGANHAFLTDGSYLVLTPRFSPTDPEITYLSYIDDRPRVYLLNIETGRQELLGDFPGMTFAPRFAPDGNSVIMSQTLNGATDIFEMDLHTRRIQRLTNSIGIDTAPSYAPDGERIAFESDRGGSQQLYVMDADGSDPTRISFGDGRYGNPVWSPRGDLIAFTKQMDGDFFIGVIEPDGSGERLISRAYHVEGPTWAPNGRVLMYFKETPADANGQRSVELYSIDITGMNERQVPTPLDGSDPAWSPPLQ